MSSSSKCYASGAVVLYKDRLNTWYILMVKDKKNGFWNIPGGMLEKKTNEGILQCAMRETLEETHGKVDLKHATLFGKSHNFYVGNFAYIFFRFQKLPPNLQPGKRGIFDYTHQPMPQGLSAASSEIIALRWTPLGETLKKNPNFRLQSRLFPCLEDLRDHIIQKKILQASSPKVPSFLTDHREGPVCMACNLPVGPTITP